jgi:hypothetical protein
MTASRQDLTAPSEGCQVEGMTSPQSTNRNSPFQSQSRLQIIGLPFMTRVISHGARDFMGCLGQTDIIKLFRTEKLNVQYIPLLDGSLNIPRAV